MPVSSVWKIVLATEAPARDMPVPPPPAWAAVKPSLFAPKYGPGDGSHFEFTWHPG